MAYNYVGFMTWEWQLCIFSAMGPGGDAFVDTACIMTMYGKKEKTTCSSFT
jgi:hypothetical protein